MYWRVAYKEVTLQTMTSDTIYSYKKIISDNLDNGISNMLLL